MMDASLRAAVQARLQALHLEYSSGNAKARELERQQAQLNEVMLRISGAIQVLEETLAEAEQPQASQPKAFQPQASHSQGDETMKIAPDAET